MPLPLPNLDDRDFEQLVQEATQRVRQSNTAWDDLSPSDPGVGEAPTIATLRGRRSRLMDTDYSWRL